jgi:hypothetical protein
MKFIVVTFLMFSSTAFANKDVGNGGSVIFNQNGSPKIELLDFYEKFGLGGVPKIPGNTYQEKISALFDKVSRRFPTLAKEWKEEALDFESQAELKSGVILPEIPDSHPVALPDGYSIRQIVNQRPDDTIYPGQKKFVVSKDLWDQLDDDNRAGLVTHEILYKRAIKNGAENSIGVRYFNGILADASILGFSDQDLISILTKSYLGDFELATQGTSLRMKTFMLRDNCLPFSNPCTVEQGVPDWQFNANGSFAGLGKDTFWQAELMYNGNWIKLESVFGKISVSPSGLFLEAVRSGKMDLGANSSLLDYFEADGVLFSSEKICGNSLHLFSMRPYNQIVSSFYGMENQKGLACLPQTMLSPNQGKPTWQSLNEFAGPGGTLRISDNVPDWSQFFGNLNWKGDSGSLEYDYNFTRDEYRFHNARFNYPVGGKVREFSAEFQVDKAGNLVSVDGKPIR